MAELELLDAAGGDVRCGRAEYLIGNVYAVHFNSSGAAETAGEGDGGVPILADSEVGCILNLNTGFQLCQIEKIPPVDRQVFNLFSIQHTLHCGLFGVHPCFGPFYLDNFVLLR